MVITVLVFSVKVGLQGKSPIDSLLVGLALAVGMTPQLLPAVTSVVLAAGAQAMSRQQVIVKQLLSIENLGSITVLCSDKTGTLTEGNIELLGALDIEGQPSSEVLQLAYINASFQSGFDNPIDRAICDFAIHSPPATVSQITEGFSLRESLVGMREQVRRLDELPYDFTRRRLSIHIECHSFSSHQYRLKFLETYFGTDVFESTSLQDFDGLPQLDDGTTHQRLLVTKGALAQILECCTYTVLPNGRLQDLEAFRSEIENRFQNLSSQGLRVLGLAVRPCDSHPLTADDERDMVFLGFLVFADPPKLDARQTIEDLKKLGVSLKIITGDNRTVAASISKQVGFSEPTVLTGSELRMLNDAALAQRARMIDIFAEVEPNQKEQIILALKRAGHIVGYLGDGINDASALHSADIGISVASAVDVAKEAAQVVLLRQDLSVLVEGVREGRRTFSNTLKYIFFAIAANFGYMFSLAIAGLFLPFEPLLASQILLVNLMADFPAMALATDTVDREQIAQPRRWDTRFLVKFMMTFGLASSCFDFLTFGALYWFFSHLSSTGDSLAFEKLFQTGWFIESTLTGLVILLAIRTQRPLLYSQPGRLFLLAELSVAVCTLSIPFS
ncbi:MAG: HAD-IC family P-type ATPase, partial [Planctomycetales bacterium]|nr:HAD-IC family P-type ATPase [Planctomycetales bacterium]